MSDSSSNNKNNGSDSDSDSNMAMPSWSCNSTLPAGKEMTHGGLGPLLDPQPSKARAICL
ncbi:MAG: hypothetical protein Q9194_006393 [Teloschistes cf. exilis]